MMNPITKFKNWRIRRCNHREALAERNYLYSAIVDEERGQQASAAFAFFIDNSPQSMRRIHRKIRDHDDNIRIYRQQIAEVNKRIEEFER